MNHHLLRRPSLLPSPCKPCSSPWGLRKDGHIQNFSTYSNHTSSLNILLRAVRCKLQEGRHHVCYVNKILYLTQCLTCDRYSINIYTLAIKNYVSVLYSSPLLLHYTSNATGKQLMNWNYRNNRAVFTDCWPI